MDAELRLRYPTALDLPQEHGDEPHLKAQGWLQDACRPGRLQSPKLAQGHPDPVPSGFDGGSVDSASAAAGGEGGIRAFRRLARRRSPAGSDDDAASLKSAHGQGAPGSMCAGKSEGHRPYAAAPARIPERCEEHGMGPRFGRAGGSAWDTFADWDPWQDGRLAPEEAYLGCGAGERYPRHRPRSAPGPCRARGPVQYDREWPSPPRLSDRIGETSSSWCPTPTLKRAPRNDPMSRGAQMRALWSKDRFLRGQRSGARKFDLRGCGTPVGKTRQRSAATTGMLIPDYIPPHERRRDALRLQVRQQMLAPDVFHA